MIRQVGRMDGDMAGCTFAGIMSNRNTYLASVLSDNRTCNDQLQKEHGLSILLDTGRYRVLILKAVMGEQLHAFSCGTTITV